MTRDEEIKARRRAVDAACNARRATLVRRGAVLFLAFAPEIGRKGTPTEGQRRARTVAIRCQSAAEARAVEERFALLQRTRASYPPAMLNEALELQRAAMRQATRRARGRRTPGWYR